MSLWRLKSAILFPDEASKLLEENQMLRNESRNFQDLISQLQEKLKKKQESFLIIQQDKENVFNDFRFGVLFFRGATKKVRSKKS